MKKQISTVMAAIVFLLSCTVVMAQNEEEMHAEKKESMNKEMEAFMDDLNLDDAQRAEFVALNDKYRTKIKSVKSSDADKETKKTEVMALKEQHNAEVKALLTEEQYEQYQMHKKKKKEKMKKSSEY